MSDVIFRATTRGGKNFVEVIDTGTDFDRYEIKMNDSIDYSDTIKGVLAMLIHHSGWKSGMFDKIEFDDTGMSLGEQYLQIMKMINKEFGFLYKSPTGSRERQYYFDIIRFISRNIKNDTMSVEELIEKSKDALRAKGIMSSRRINSSQKGFENVVEGTQYDDYHIDTRGMGILDVENIIGGIESRGNQAVLTVQCSDGSVQHTYFPLKDWKEYKDTKNNSGVQVTDVWITEVEPTYVRNSRRPVKSSVRWSNDDYIVETFEEYGNGEFYVSDKDTDGRKFCKTFWSEKDAVEWAKNNPLKKVKSSRQIKSSFPRTTKELADWINKNSRHKVQYREPFDDFVFKENSTSFRVDGDEVVMEGHGYSDSEPLTVYINQFKADPSYIRSARYIATDPESGEVLGSADTYEEAVNEWGEDVTITDSEAAEGQEEGGLFQSRKSIKSNLNVNDEAAYWDGAEDGVNGLPPADEDDPDYMKGWKAGKARLKSMNTQDYNVNSSRRPIKSSLQTEVVENFPEYMVNYAVYGERLDVTNEDVSLYEEWRERNGYGTCFGTGSVYDESYFSNNPAFGLPCTVIPVVFEVSDSISSSRKSIKSGINDECIGTSKDGRYSIYKNDVDKVYMFAEDGRFTKEVDYDDDEVDGVLENWKEIYDIPLKSSKKPETTKQFMTRILSELETGEITEDEAAKEIAEANDVNIGYAKQILSNYIADKDRYITSGMLELGEALNMEFNPDGNLDSWSVDFVSDPEKSAPTLGGELVRAARYIIAAFRDSGEKIGWGYAKEMLNPAARFIIENTDFTGNDAINDMLEGNVPDDESYREWIDEFEVEFADYLRDHEDYFHKLNKKDFTEGKNEGDSFSPVKELLISDDEGNDYFFEYIDGQFVCTGVDEGTTPEYTEGDVITAEDYMFDDINFDEEFGKFEQDGFMYSWEDGDGESVTISDVSLKNPMFWYDDILTEEEIANLIENGVKIYDPSKGTSDTNRRELKISDIM